MKIQPADPWSKPLRGCEWANIVSPDAFCSRYEAVGALRSCGHLQRLPNHDTSPRPLLGMRLSARYSQAVQGVASKMLIRVSGSLGFIETDLIL
jgi:hypothetical protein